MGHGFGERARMVKPIEYIMKLLSSQNLFVVGALTMGLVACAAAPAPSPLKEQVAAGPVGPTATASATSTAALPSDVVELARDDKDALKKPILADQSMQDLDEAAQPPRTRGPTDPLASPRLSTEQDGRGAQGEGGMFGGVPGGIAGSSKGPSQHGGANATGGTNIGAATEVRGSIDKAEIQRVVRTHVNDVKHCYDQGLARRPDLEGKVVLKFTIGKTGSVVAATVQETSLNERQVEQCIASAAMRWTFPKPTGEGIVVISYPFILKSGS